MTQPRETFYPADQAGEIPGVFLSLDGPGTLLQPNAISRDGRRHLRRFFELVPTPRNPSEGITIPWRFRAMVPAAWKSSVRFYRYSHRAPSTVSECQSFLVCGVFFPAHQSLPSAKRKLDLIRRAAKQAVPKARTRFLFTFSELDGSAPRKSSFENEIVDYFFDCFGDGAEPLSLGEFHARTTFTDWSFVEITPSHEFADSFLLQKLLSRGAVPLFPRYQGLLAPQAGFQYRLPLSPHHGIAISGDSAQILDSWTRMSATLKAFEYTAALPP